MVHVRIKYKDPETDEFKEYEGDFEDLSWAEDYAYTLADKGWYEIEFLNDKKHWEKYNGWQP